MSLIFRAWDVPEIEADDGFAFYKISFQWYSTIGAIMFWIPAIIVSHATGGQDLSKFNMKLLSPFIRRMLPRKYHHTELKPLDKKMSNDKETNETIFRHELTELITQNNKKNLMK